MDNFEKMLKLAADEADHYTREMNPEISKSEKWFAYYRGYISGATQLEIGVSSGKINICANCKKPYYDGVGAFCSAHCWHTYGG